MLAAALIFAATLASEFLWTLCSWGEARKNYPLVAVTQLLAWTLFLATTKTTLDARTTLDYVAYVAGPTIGCLIAVRFRGKLAEESEASRERLRW